MAILRVQDPTDSAAPDAAQQAVDSLAAVIDSLAAVIGNNMASAQPSLQMELVLPHLLLLLLVLVGLPLFARWREKKPDGADPPPLKGLNLPEGSVRSMLALLIVGSLLLTLNFGTESLGSAYAEVVSILGTLAGSVLGFYFGSRGSQS